MFSRYALISGWKEIRKRLEIDESVDSWHFSSPNIALGERSYVLTQQSPKIPKLMTFGIPDGDDSFIFNVRAEGRKRNIYNEWTYTGAKGVVGGEWQQYVLHSRCAIIVDAFMVGEKYEKPYLVFPRDKKRPFLVAGLAVGKCFAPLSIFGNPLMKEVGSDRAPVILTGPDIYHWLNASTKSYGVSQLMKPMDHRLFNAYPISVAIGSPKNKFMHMLAPTGPRIFEEGHERRERESNEWALRKLEMKRQREKMDAANYERKLKRLRDEGLIP